MKTLAFLFLGLILSLQASAGSSARLYLRAYVPPSANAKENVDGVRFKYNKNLKLAVKLYKGGGRQPASIIEDKEIFLERAKLKREGITKISVESP